MTKAKEWRQMFFLSQVWFTLTLKKLHSLECNNLIKYGFRLSLIALVPSSMEKCKQNVKLVLQILNQIIYQGLIELGTLHNWLHNQDTADFITLIMTWWQIMNVKSPTKRLHLRNKYKTPFTCLVYDGKLICFKQISWLAGHLANKEQ